MASLYLSALLASFPQPMNPLFSLRLYAFSEAEPQTKLRNRELTPMHAN